MSLALPVLAAAFGLLEGRSHWSPLTPWEYRSGARTAVTFVQMVPMPAVAAMAGGISAQLDPLLTSGFALDDVLLAPPAWPASGPFHDRLLFRMLPPRLFALMLLFLLAVQPILMAHRRAGSLGAGTRWAMRLPSWAMVALAVRCGRVGVRLDADDAPGGSPVLDVGTARSVPTDQPPIVWSGANVGGTSGGGIEPSRLVQDQPLAGASSARPLLVPADVSQGRRAVGRCCGARAGTAHGPALKPASKQIVGRHHLV